MAPKVGRMEIDYQVLHDAFFKFQTKPKLTIHGDLYYEGKEFEITLKEKRPGHLSDDLKVNCHFILKKSNLKLESTWYAGRSSSSMVN
jgi:hypothetical protein